MKKEKRKEIIKTMNQPEWDKIFSALEKWRDELVQTDPSDLHPSVNTIAEQYRCDPWAVLVSTIISLRTKDEVTLVSSQRLLQKAPDPTALHAMDEGNVAMLIYPAGFFRNKAASLKKIAAVLIKKYKGNVPSSIDELLALPGVGRKTANLVLNEAFNIDAICVDIHVHRISNRCGWLESKTPEETEKALREILPVKYWKRINYLLVLYGQKLCRPVSPFCSHCVIGKYCERRTVHRSR